jgi:hypothetical protein
MPWQQGVNNAAAALSMDAPYAEEQESRTAAKNLNLDIIGTVGKAVVGGRLTNQFGEWVKETLPDINSVFDSPEKSHSKLTELYNGMQQALTDKQTVIQSLPKGAARNKAIMAVVELKTLLERIGKPISHWSKEDILSKYNPKDPQQRAAFLALPKWKRDKITSQYKGQ